MTDAERYQWLKSRAVIEDRDAGYTGHWVLPRIHAWNATPYAKGRGESFDYATMDAAIDAAARTGP